MGLSFHDERSMVEASIGSLLRFVPRPDIANPPSENGIINEERRHDSQIQLNDDSDIWQMVDR